MKKSGFVLLVLAGFLAIGSTGVGASDTGALVRSVLDGIGATVVECPTTETRYARQRVCATYAPNLHDFRQAWNDYLETDLAVPVESGRDWVMGWSACCHRDYRIENTGLRATIDFNADLVTIDYRETTPDANGNEVSQPSVLKETKVKLPKEARKNKITGKVALEVVVQPDGTVADVALDWACPQGHGLEEAAAEAVQRWRFEPAVRNGVPVEGSTTVLVEFRRNVVGKATDTASARPAPVMERSGF